MPNPVEELCSRHRYPNALREVLLELVDATRDAYPDAKSFVLSGSASTGDYVYREDESGVELVSDLDMTLFTDRRGARPERLDEAIAAIKQRHPSPVFQVDIAIEPTSALRAIPAIFQMVETRHAGVVLAGEDVRGHYPDHFDGRDARRAFLLNLWKPVLYWTPAGGEHDLTYTQVVARFFLDLPLLVATERGQCIPGHRARAASYADTDEHRGLFSDTLRERVGWAVVARENASSDRAGLEQAVASFAFEVVEALDGQGPVPHDPDPALVRRLGAWLPPRTPRRVAAELRSIVRDPRRPGLDLRWLQSKKEAVGGAALLGLLGHLATSRDGVIRGEVPPGIGGCLGTFSRQGPLARGEGESELDFLCRAKQAYWQGLATQFPSLQKKQTGFEPFLRSPTIGRDSATLMLPGRDRA
ncbi:MAG: hypothetical protein GY944_23630 [bacterium]|nr:hypothetical protein [bacterium]